MKNFGDFFLKSINHTSSKNKFHTFQVFVKKGRETYIVYDCSSFFLFLEYKTDSMLPLENWTYTTERVSK